MMTCKAVRSRPLNWAMFHDNLTSDVIIITIIIMAVVVAAAAAAAGTWGQRINTMNVRRTAQWTYAVVRRQLTFVEQLTRDVPMSRWPARPISLQDHTQRHNDLTQSYSKWQTHVQTRVSFSSPTHRTFPNIELFGADTHCWKCAKRPKQQSQQMSCICRYNNTRIPSAQSMNEEVGERIPALPLPHPPLPFALPSP